MSKTFILRIKRYLTQEAIDLVNAYGLNGKGVEAIELFNRIPAKMIDNYIYVCVLNACSHSGLIDEGENIFNSIPQEQKTEKIYTSMVSNLFFLNKSISFLNRLMVLVVHFNLIVHNV